MIAALILAGGCSSSREPTGEEQSTPPVSTSSTQPPVPTGTADSGDEEPPDTGDAPRDTATPLDPTADTATPSDTGPLRSTGDTGDSGHFTPTPDTSDTGDLPTGDTGDTGDTGPLFTQVTPLAAPVSEACVAAAGLWFTDVSACSGTDAWHITQVGQTWYSTGQGFADLNADGWLDLLVTSQDGSNRLYLNDGDGTFTERPEAALAGFEAGALAFADTDADGDLDVYVGGLDEGLLLETSPGSLTVDQTFVYPGDSAGVAWGDLEGDGLLELYVSNYCTSLFDPALDSCADYLLTQQPSGMWSDISTLLGDTLRVGAAFTPQFTDWDDDGDMDVYIVNDDRHLTFVPPGGALMRNAYWRNDSSDASCTSPPCLAEVGSTNGMGIEIAGMGIAVGDLDGDLDLDTVMTDIDGLYVVENLGGGQFQSTFHGRGLVETFVGWGLVLADFDNDGWLDLAANSSGDEYFWRNDGTGNFIRVTTAAAPSLPSSRGMAQGDYDRDGRVDLAIGDHALGYRLLRNTHTNTNHWIGLRLNTAEHGASPLGTRVYVTDSSGHQQVREISSGSSLGAGHDLGVHFGLGTASPTEVRVVWPEGTEELLTVGLDRWNVVQR